MRKFNNSKLIESFAVLILLGNCLNAFAVNLNWGQTHNFPPIGDIVPFHNLALSADGTKATAIWLQRSGSRDLIRTASSTINGKTSSWGPVITLGFNFSLNTPAPEISLSADGSKAIAVWEHNKGGTTTVRSAFAIIDGNVASWSAAATLSDNREVSGSAKISLSADGSKAIAVWTFYDFDSTVLQSRFATLNGNTVTWSAIDELYVSNPMNGNNTPAFAQVQLSADGSKATALWIQLLNAVQSRSAILSGDSIIWGPAEYLTAKEQLVGPPDFALSADGTKATAVWSQFVGSINLSRSRSAVISGNSATWGSVTTLPDAGQNAITPKIALSEDGTKATVVWNQFNGLNDDRILSRSALISENTASWGFPKNLSASGQNASGPQIALSENGTTASVVWTHSDINSPDDVIGNISARIDGKDATWGSVINLSAPSSLAITPLINISADGTKATAIWAHRAGSAERVQSRSAVLAQDIMPVLDLLLFQ